MEIVIFSSGVIAFICVWVFLLKPALRDYTRDQLFDLRDNLRQDFIDNNWSIESDIYSALRDLANANLRYIDRMTLIRVILFGKTIERDYEFKAYIEGRIKEKYSSQKEDIQKYADNFRKKMTNALVFWMLISSLPTLFIMFAIGSVMLCVEVIKRTKSTLSTTMKHVKSLVEDNANFTTQRLQRLVFADQLNETCQLA